MPAYVPPHRRASAAAPSSAPPSSSIASSSRSANPPFSFRCSCEKSGARHAIYTDGHAISSCRWGSLLGGTSQFCASFYHIEPTPEGGIPELCLNAACGQQPCPRKTVVLVARLQQQKADNSWTDVYVARYSNCFQGGTEANMHAEKFLLSDPKLSAALNGMPQAGGRLILYLTYQPCHHSGGHKKRGMGEHGTSCTELLLRFVADVLMPRRIILDIRLTYIYRAHWAQGGYDRKYEPAVMAARRGLELLAQQAPHVELSALAPSDWDWLIGQCDEKVRSMWREGKHPLGEGAREARQKMDAFVADFLAGFGRTRSDGDVAAAVEVEEEPNGRATIVCERCIVEDEQPDAPAPAADEKKDDGTRATTTTADAVQPSIRHVPSADADLSAYAAWAGAIAASDSTIAKDGLLSASHAMHAALKRFADGDESIAASFDVAAVINIGDLHFVECRVGEALAGLLVADVHEAPMQILRVLVAHEFRSGGARQPPTPSVMTRLGHALLTHAIGADKAAAARVAFELASVACVVAHQGKWKHILETYHHPLCGSGTSAVEPSKDPRRSPLFVWRALSFIESAFTTKVEYERWLRGAVQST